MKLSPEDYTKIVAEGRAAEVLATFVRKPGGRPRTMTTEERKVKQKAYIKQWRGKRREELRAAVASPETVEFIIHDYLEAAALSGEPIPHHAAHMILRTHIGSKATKEMGWYVEHLNWNESDVRELLALYGLGGDEVTK